MAHRRRLRWMIGGILAVVIAVPVTMVAIAVIERSIGRVTVETATDGSERMVYWREYPGIAGLDHEGVLAGPSLEEGLKLGEKLTAALRLALTAEFGLDWVPDPNADGKYDAVHPRVENGFGGSSMLAVVNAPTSQSTSVPTTWPAKQRVIEVIAELTAGYGFSAPVLDHKSPYLTGDDRVCDVGDSTPAEQVLVSGIVEGPAGQWLFFSLQDLSLDHDGCFEERLGDTAWEPNTVMFSYGANGLLPRADRAEFERRLEPFRGLEPPPPFES